MDRIVVVVNVVVVEVWIEIIFFLFDVNKVEVIGIEDYEKLDVVFGGEVFCLFDILVFVVVFVVVFMVLFVVVVVILIILLFFLVGVIFWLLVVVIIIGFFVVFLLIVVF